MKNFVRFLALLFCMNSLASAQWIQQQSGVSTLIGGVWFTSPLYGWAVGQNSVILRTTDGGASWNQVTSPVMDAFYKVAFVDSANGWITGEHNVILSTTNGGNLWESGSSGSPFDATDYGVFPANFDGRTNCWVAGGWASDAYTVIEKLNTYGQWTPQVMGFAGRLVRLFFLNDSVGWAAGDSDLILSTTNGGLWWNQQPVSPVPNHQGFNDIKFFNSQVGLCVGDGGVIMRSADGGSHWSLVRSSKGDIFFRLALTNDSTAYAAGAIGGKATILRSTDRGVTWTSQDVDAPAGTWFEDIYFVSDSEGWAVGSNGLIVHTTNGGLGTALLTPSLLMPTTGDTVLAQDTALAWYAVPKATSYQVQIASDSSFSNIVVDSAGITDTTLAMQGIVGSKLSPDTKYFWHVRAAGAASESPFSEIWSFISSTLSVIKGIGLGMPTTYQLSQNYPNPFNPSTTIKYSIPEAQFVNLTVYNVLGEKVATLVDEQQSPGYYEVNFNADRFASGVYFYVLKAGNFTASHKMVPLK